MQTTTAGSLPRPNELRSANTERPVLADGFTLGSDSSLETSLRDAVHQAVTRQRSVGLTILGDGEYGKAMEHDVDYRAWRSYLFQRVSGLSLVDGGPGRLHRNYPARELRLQSFEARRDRILFPAVYGDPSAGTEMGESATAFPAVTGPLEYHGLSEVARDINNLRSALRPGEQGFLTAISPGSAARVENHFYTSDAEHLFAWADVLRVEYCTILAAGFVLQIDDPSLAENWDLINPEPPLSEYLAFTRLRIEALNYALRGLPQDRVRVHVCWGSWHGPHVTDLELDKFITLLLEIDAMHLSFEAANPRHEHEWEVWQQMHLGQDRVLVPGVVSHATNVVEHPMLVAQRLERFARIVGPDRVVASTDCGLGGRIHPDIAWAKLRALVEGSRLVSSRL